MIAKFATTTFYSSHEKTFFINSEAHGYKNPNFQHLNFHEVIIVSFTPTKSLMCTLFIFKYTSDP